MHSSFVTVWFEPFFCMQKCFQHSFIEQHVAHRLGDNNVNFFWQIDLFDFTGNHLNLFQAVVLC